MIKVDIIKRIKALEQKFSEVDIPEFVMIYYDWQNNAWIVDEKFQALERRILHYKHYRDYVFHPKFDGMVILDSLDCPDEFQSNLFSFDMGDFRKEHNLKNCCISFECVPTASDGILECSFAVTVHE